MELPMTSATFHSDSSARRRGFTLTEILVVIGIIVVLVGILLPTVMKAYTQANKNKAALELQAIGTALEAYKADFGDYPRTAPGSTDTGAHVLCRALFAPGPQSDVTPGDQQGDGAGTGANGTTPALGFRVRPGGSGKVWGPYLQTDRWIIDDDTTAGDTIGSYANVVIYTKEYTPILYYPATPTKPNVTLVPSATSGGYCEAYTANWPLPLYCSSDNVTLLATPNLQGLLGDYSCNGAIDSTYGAEQSIGNFPYLLFNAGPDGIFGPSTALNPSVSSAAGWTSNKALIASCDDITNFPR